MIRRLLVATLLTVVIVTFGTGCPPAPETCALTQAGATCWFSNTGVSFQSNGTHYTEAQIVAGNSPLTHITTDLRIDVDNTTLDSKWIDGCISVHANNFTLTHSLVRTEHWCDGGDGTSASSYAVNNGGCHNPGNYHMDLVDVEIDAGAGTGDYTGVGTCNYTLNRVHVHGGTKNAWAGHNVAIQWSFFNALTPNAGANHEASIDADSSDHVSIDHSYIDSSGAGATTGAADFNTTWGSASYGSVTNTFLRGGAGYDLVAGGAVYVDHHMTVTGNAFSNDNGHGSTNYVLLWDPAQAGQTWSGNYVAEDTSKTVNSNGTITP